jgi:hypothetical protein
MKAPFFILLVAAVCAGCSQSGDNSRIESISQKLDAISQAQVLISSNQTVILNELADQSTNLPLQFNSLAYFYHTNMLSFVEFEQQTTKESVNGETRRVAVIMFTNFAGFQADTLDTLNQIKLSEPDAAQNAMRIKMERDVTQIQGDVDKIKLRLGIAY